MDRKRHLGLTEHVEGKSDPGYTLFTPFGHQTTYLIDMEGRVVHRWALPYTAGLWACLLETGTLLMGAATGKSPFGEGGAGGAVIELDWDGDVVWRYDDDAQHHDFSRCPNGNTMVLGREPVPEDLTGAIRGGMPGTEVDGRIWADYFHEVTPSGEVVWEWHAHEALDLEEDVLCALHRRHEWAHANACTVLPDGNVLTSFRVLDTIGIIDRATGALAWKYHNPGLGHQHDPTLLDSGNILVFANGYHAPDPPPIGSRVFEINPRTNEVVWEYRTRPSWQFFSSFIGGAQRLSNGNTLVCEGMTGRLFEVTMDGEVVWEYVNPYYGEHRIHGTVNSIFRARRHSPDFPGLAGKDLTPEGSN